MPEAERNPRRRTLSVWADQLLPRQREEPVRRSPGRRPRSGLRRRLRGTPAFDGTTLDHGSRRPRPAPRPGREEGDRLWRDRCRRPDLPRSDPPGRRRPSSISIASISTNSGLPSAASRMRSRATTGISACPRRLSTSWDASSPVRGPEQDRGRVHLAAAPARPNLEQLGARDAQEQDRGDVARPVREMFDQIEERRLRPMDVVEDHHDRSLVRQVLEELPDGPERVLRRAGLSPPEEPGDQ